MEKEKALDKMMASCSRREYCPRDIMDKLSRLDVPKCEAEWVVERLCKEKFIDEARYAAAFARDKSSLQGWGPVKIRAALTAKGIDADTVTAALGEIDSPAAESKLKALLQSKMRQLKDEQEQTRRAKLLRFALGRGYEYAQILKEYDNIRTT